MFANDTIIAAATPKGAGALAILRISGHDAFEMFTKMIAEKEKFDSAKPFTTKLYTIRNEREVLDEVMAIKYVAPKSFTGDDMIELTCHGGSIIVERLIQYALEIGMRYAGRGEFTQRAFLNGKVDLKKAESINRIIHAESVTAHRTAVRHYLGEERQFFDAMRNDLIKMLVALETEIEFSETDDVGEEAAFTAQIAELLGKIERDFTKELKKREVLHQLDKGVSVALVGQANAGKSSLMNMLVGYDRAIINSRAGTTRDLITETCLIDDIKVQFVDTAGLNETDDEIELEGIRRTRGAIDEAEILLWVVDGSQPFPKHDFNLIPRDKPLFGIVNKNDLGDCAEAKSVFADHKIPVLPISAINGEGREIVIEAVKTVLLEKFSDMEYETAIGSEREAGIIRRMLAEIEEVDLAYSPEIVAESIRALVNGFDEIYGKNSPDDILNKLFSDFCIGK